MVTIASLAETAALIGDPARAAMLYAMMDGRAFAAGELARTAGIAPPTASSHLARLLEAGLLAVERQGRHRYFRLASSEVGTTLEGLLVVTAHREAAVRSPALKPLIVGPRDKTLRHARICYDHLAGEIGVAIFSALVAQGKLRIHEDGVQLTDSGSALFDTMAIIAASEPAMPSCRPCLDWSERRHHLAGPAGAALCRHALALGWVRRIAGTRALQVTPPGVAALHRHFGVRL